MASRMAARSTTAGTPVKSCIRTRAGRKAISLSLLRSFEPLGNAANIVGGDASAVLVAQQILQQHLERERQAGDPGKPVRLGLFQVEIVVGLAVDIERAPAIEAVERGSSADVNGISLKT